MKTASVFDFISLHAFFDALRRDMRRADSKYSLQMFAKKLGLKSRAMVGYLATGQRNFSDDQLRLLGEFCEWNEDELQYARLLRAYDVASTLSERKYALAEIEAFRPGIRPEVMPAAHEDELIEWPMPLMTTLVELKDFEPSVGWIRARTGFQLHEVEIDRALKRLEKLGVIASDGRGGYKTQPVSLIYPSNTSAKGPSRQALIAYHKQMLVKAGQALDKQASHERFFNGSYLTIPAAKIPEAIEYISEFRRKFLSLMSDNQPAEEVYYLSLQFFRMTFPVDRDPPASTT